MAWSRQSTSLEPGLGRKVRSEERAFQEGAPGSKSAGRFLAGSGRSQESRLRPWPKHLRRGPECGSSDPSAQKLRAPGDSQQGVTRWSDFEYNCLCLFGDCEEAVSCVLSKLQEFSEFCGLINTISKSTSY